MSTVWIRGIVQANVPPTRAACRKRALRESPFRSQSSTPSALPHSSRLPQGDWLHGVWKGAGRLAHAFGNVRVGTPQRWFTMPQRLVKRVAAANDTRGDVHQAPNSMTLECACLGQSMYPRLRRCSAISSSANAP
jgi:hypothetical protein